MHAAMGRTIGPPAAAGTMMAMGRAGRTCAPAGPTFANAAATAVATNSFAMNLLQTIATANAVNVQTAIKASIIAINSGYTAAFIFYRLWHFCNQRAPRIGYSLDRVSLTRFLPRLGSACAGLFFRRRPCEPAPNLIFYTAN
jgi:hypothetical protein